MSKIQFLSWSSFGEVSVAVDGKVYKYKGDAAWFPEWQRRARRTPGKVFNEVKKYCTLITDN